MHEAMTACFAMEPSVGSGCCATVDLTASVDILLGRTGWHLEGSRFGHTAPSAGGVVKAMLYFFGCQANHLSACFAVDKVIEALSTILVVVRRGC